MESPCWLYSWSTSLWHDIGSWYHEWTWNHTRLQGPNDDLGWLDLYKRPKVTSRLIGSSKWLFLEQWSLWDRGTSRGSYPSPENSWCKVCTGGPRCGHTGMQTSHWRREMSATCPTSQNEHLFNGTLGTWNNECYNIELKEGDKPYHSRPFPIPKIHERNLKVELAQLIKLGVLKQINASEWAAPTFIISKKDATVGFISDFRELNICIKCKPFPIPKIQDLLLKLEGFQHATSLDLNMGYYHIELMPFSKRLCTIITPWGKYKYQQLPMGLCNSPNIFQEHMFKLFSDLEYVQAYIDDLLVTSCSIFEEHLEKVFLQLSEMGLKVNTNKSHFARFKIEYLGYWITQDGIQPLPKKVEALQNIAPPKNKKQLQRFLRMVNYYHDMWIRWSRVLTSLTRLTSANIKFEWTNVEQMAFDKMKQIVRREMLLSYPDFNQPFEIHWH